ncbi:hypothetical protein OAO19_03065 [Gammaproteobacteria bacterium]|nr:hypothetical protein [Gammaproteobacteria bacterium]
MIETRNRKGELIAVQLDTDEQYELALKNNRMLRELKKKQNAEASRHLKERNSSPEQEGVQEET